MAIVQQLQLFSWKNFHNDINNLGDLERLKLVIETLPDQKLLISHESLVNKMFYSLVKELLEMIPDFGKISQEMAKPLPVMVSHPGEEKEINEVKKMPTGAKKPTAV